MRLTGTIQKRPFFFNQQKFKAEKSFSVARGWVICGLSDRSGSEGAERSHLRSEATKLSGARMPEQRRAGQLVGYEIPKPSIY